MPGALQALALRPPPAPGTEGKAALVENVPLCLPSDLTPEQRRNGCREGLAKIENQLRDAQCRGSLDRLRNQLHIKSRLLTYKGGNVRHQGPNTRSRGLINRNEAKIRLHSEKYQAAWEARKKLAGGDEGLVGWRRLLMKDIRCMEEQEDVNRENAKREKQRKKKGAAGPGEGRREISWIWLGSDSVSLHEGLCVEWAKAWARVRCWSEEVLLLEEEQRRVPISLQHRAVIWRQRQGERTVNDAALAEGIRAYAEGQAQILEGLANRCEQAWKGELGEGGASGEGLRREREDDEAVEAADAGERDLLEVDEEGAVEDKF